MQIPSAYDDDPRVVRTTRGLSFSSKGTVYFINRDDRNVSEVPDDRGEYSDGVPGVRTAPSAWNIMTADGASVGYTDDPDAAVGMLLGPPQSMAAAS